MNFGVNDMKIDGASISIGNIQAVNRMNQVEKKKTQAGSDNVAVSDKAQTFQALLQKAKEIPPVREERVRELSEQIERGEFKVNGPRIAENLLSPKI